MCHNLCEAKEVALNKVNPLLFKGATLTGHVVRCYGDNYAVSYLKNVEYDQWLS
jgi:hypothetical protein